MRGKRFIETIIIGAGPAGLQLAYFLDRAGRDYLVLDAGARAGGFFETHPRHRKLISINKQFTGREETDFNLRHDWNCLLTHPGEEMPFKDFSPDYFPNADDLVEYLNAFRDRFELAVQFETRVERVSRSDAGEFELGIRGESGLRCKRLVVATGVSVPNLPEIEGIELADGYEDMSIDPADYAGKTVLVLGKGNSALETAEHLMPYASFIHLSSRHPVKFAWDSHFVGNVRSVNGTFFDSYLLKSQNAVLDGPTKAIRRTENGKLEVVWSATHHDVDEEIEHFYYDKILRCCGFNFDAGMFDESCRPDLAHDGRLPAMDGRWESANVPGLFFAGVLMQTLDFKRSQSAFIHGFRYNVRTLFHVLENEAHGVPLPADAIELDPKPLAAKLIARANSCSALWQQVGFMCDVVTFPKGGGGSALWHYELTTPYVEDVIGADPDAEYYVCMFTYGPSPVKEGYTAFDHPHVYPNRDAKCMGDLTTEIHPVLRRYRGRELQMEYHVRTDVLTDWQSPFYVEPLLEFLAWDLGLGPKPKATKPRWREITRNADMRLAHYKSGEDAR